MLNPRPLYLAAFLLLVACSDDNPGSLGSADVTSDAADAAGGADGDDDAAADTTAPEDSAMDGAGDATTGDDANPVDVAADTEADTAADAAADTETDAGSAPADPVEAIETVDPADLILPEWVEDAEGDMLLNVRTGDCLSVRDADGLAAGATVEVRVCRGVAEQRWIVGDADVRPAEASDLCLASVGGWGAPITLAPCAEAELDGLFEMADDGVLERGGIALDVTAAFELIVYGTHRGENQRWQWLADDLAFLADNAGHTVTYPFAHDDALSFAMEEARHRVGAVQPPYPAAAPRDVSAFPGDIDDDAPMASRRVRLDRAFDHDNGYLRVAWPPQHWQSTGLYAPAGRVVVVDVPDDADATGLAVRINVHTDVLRPDSANVAGGTFDRMPRLSLRVALTNGLNAVRSPYGGTMILESTVDTGEVVPIEIHGAVAMPRFVRGATTQSEWEERRTLGAPWAELEGDLAVITVPAEKVRSLGNPGEVMARYDEIVTLEQDLFALDGTGVHRPYSGKARFVEDLQITAGWGHSGFPVMTQLGWNLASMDEMDSWGIWHELGHNHQQFCLWSTRFGTESTVNLFSLYVQENIAGENRIADRYDETLAAVAGGMTFDEADVWQKLVFLSQPVYALDDRWEIYRRVHRAYRELSDEDAAAICADGQAQVDTFYTFLSNAAGYDLSGFFDAWGLELTADARAAVAGDGLTAPPVAIEGARP